MKPWKVKKAFTNKEYNRGPVVQKKSRYYKFLVKRVDPAPLLSDLSFENGQNTYKGYLVDVIIDDGDIK